MKRYLLFHGDTYYAAGGWRDFVNDYDELEVAEVAGKKLAEDSFTWYHVVDLTTGVRCNGEGKSNAGLGGYIKHETPE